MRNPSSTKLTPSSLIQRQAWQDAYGHEVAIPSATGLTHLQFRRYSGCAVCNLHLRSFIDHQQALCNAGIQEIVIFNSSRDHILADIPDSPFPIIADPHKYLYREFGVETSPLAVFNPKVWLPAMKGALRFGVQLPRDKETMNGLPADFLVDSQGKIIAVHYGTHAYDQWTLDELLAIAHPVRMNTEKEEMAA